VPKDLAYFEEHFSIEDPELTDRMWEVMDHLRARCPVAHSDQRLTVSPKTGFWVVTRYEDVVRVLQDWKTFSSDGEVRASYGLSPNIAGPAMPPISNDPPLHRRFRELLNPYLSPQAVAVHEPEARRIVTELIDGFIEDGSCDLVGRLFRLVPPRVLYESIFGITDRDELTQSMEWAENFQDVAVFTAWNDWIDQVMERRRNGPRRDDLIDALLHGTVGDRAVTGHEAAAAIRLLILGGFSTTTDALASATLKLIEHPDLQHRIREEPGLLHPVLDEVLRLEPPVICLSRVATRDVDLGGYLIKEGDEVLMHFGAANRDPAEFESPAEFRPARKRNRHLTFAGGPHRCIGSNLARLNLRITLVEVLSRMRDIRLAEGDSPHPLPAGLGWGPAYLPVTFTPAG
jgi:cytochrome P450